MKLLGRVNGVETPISGGSGDSIQVDVLPTASASNLGKIYQYIGTTTPNRRNGFFYKCVPGDVAGTYEWDNIDVQYGGIGGENHVYYDPIPEHTYLYGFDIHTLDSNPDTRVTYPLDVDNANYSPAYMDFANDTFNYGGWNLSPGQHFMPRPCMLNTDTTVAYYLNPNDYTKKADGTNSDVANLSFDGNAMMEWNKIYTYREMDHNGTYRFRCSDVKLGPNWECWCNYDQQNHIIPHFYTRIYGGYIDSNKLRSLSGRTLTGKKHLSSWIYYVSNTGASYYMEVLADRLLINDLLVLMCKNTDIVSKFGDGCNVLSHNTGTLNKKGMFWGTNANLTTGVKVFGMEDYWGNFHSVSPTLCSKDNGDNSDTLYYKITRGTKDGSTASDYNSTGEGYLPLYRFSNNINGYISEMVVTPCGRIPRGAEGSSSEYECSRVLFYGDRECAVFGGISKDANPFYISDSRSYDIQQGDYYIASLSCKPLLT